jgi:hypothetical protein
MKKSFLNFMFLLAFLLTAKATFAQDEREFTYEPRVFSPKEMDMMWEKFSTDKAWQVIAKEADAKGFKKITNKEASWGFEGELKTKEGKVEKVVFCTFDFLNPKNIKQGCSMVWGKVGDKSYKAYLIFPEGVTDPEKKFEQSLEWYVDANNKVQKANSWGRCFRRCMQRGVAATGVETELSRDRSRIVVGGNSYVVSCPGICLASALACSGIAAGVAVAVIGAGIVAAGSGGVGIPVLVAAGGIGAGILFTCVAGGCGTCTFMCALGCIGE